MRPARLVGTALVAAILAGGAGGSASSTARWASSCSDVDVQAALDQAQDGDTVVVPAGTCAWSSQVMVTNKALRLKGAGVDRTIIVDHVPKTGPNQSLLGIETAEGKPFRLTGFTFRGGNTGKGWNGYVVLQGFDKEWRIDHLKFEQPKSSAIRLYGYTCGVVDHCTFDLDGTQGVVVWHDRWGGANYGDGSWSNPTALGTDQAVYIEDNSFTNTWAAGAVDGLAGARLVFRFNTVANDYVANHGTESTGRFRSVRSYEIYGNTMNYPDWFTAMFIRGGTGVIFDNTLTGYVDAVQVSNFRSDSAYVPWGQCNGANPFDGNQDPSGYPCLDQVGRGSGDVISGDDPMPQAWPQEALEPVYEWNDTLNGAGGNVHSRTPVIQEGRDYFSGTPRPGYAPYAHPHLLVAAGDALDTTPPTAPTNLQAAQVSGSQIDLSWDASTDDTGVVGYSVYRKGVRVASSVATSYSDTGLSASTAYTYTVSAYDAEANESDPSLPATTTTGPLTIPPDGFLVRRLRGRLAPPSSLRQPGDSLQLLVDLGQNLLPNGAAGAVIRLSVGALGLGPFTMDTRGCFVGTDGAAGSVRGCVSSSTRGRRLQLTCTNVDLEAALSIAAGDTDRQVNTDVSLELDGATTGPSTVPVQLHRRRPTGSGTLRFRL